MLRLVNPDATQQFSCFLSPPYFQILIENTHLLILGCHIDANSCVTCHGGGNMWIVYYCLSVIFWFSFTTRYGFSAASGVFWRNLKEHPQPLRELFPLFKYNFIQLNK